MGPLKTVFARVGLVDHWCQMRENDRENRRAAEHDANLARQFHLKEVKRDREEVREAWLSDLMQERGTRTALAEEKDRAMKLERKMVVRDAQTEVRTEDIVGMQ